MAQGERSISIGGDAIRSIVNTGDGCQVFVGDYERLRDAYISPWSVFDRVQLNHFIGRIWLTDEVDAFLRGQDRGYFILEAAAGLGKTAFLAHLVKERGYIHLFAEQVRGQEGVAPGLRSLAAQLIVAWVLQPFVADDVLPGGAARPDFLDRLLREAAGTRDLRRPGEPIVLVVDGLDEAGTPPGQNVLGLPRVLPKGVYLIVSHRPVPVALTIEKPWRPYWLRAEADQNLGDMRTYLEQAACWPGIARALRESAYSSEQFITTLLEKSRGVWIYLHYIVEEIEHGERLPLDLAALPESLWGYYAEYWRRQRDGDTAAWDQMSLPLLSTLGAVQESVTATFLFELAGITSVQGMPRRLLDERWCAFLAVEEGAEKRYRLYHASLPDFLEGRVGREQLRVADRALMDELMAATRRAHGRIADRYLTKTWGGLDQGLPGLAEPGGRRLDGAYGLRHLTAHLEGAGREPDLHRLLRLERCVVEHGPDPRNGVHVWLDPSTGPQRGREIRRYEPLWFAALDGEGETGVFLGDVARAWHLAEQWNPDRSSIASLGLQCRYALMTVSINSLAGKIPIALLTGLVESFEVALFRRVWAQRGGLPPFCGFGQNSGEEADHSPTAEEGASRADHAGCTPTVQVVPQARLPEAASPSIGSSLRDRLPHASGQDVSLPCCRRCSNRCEASRSSQSIPGTPLLAAMRSSRPIACPTA